MGLGSHVASAASPVPAHAPVDPALLDPDRADWLLFRQRFIAPEGRVVDTGNQNCSHSEGQGYGMLLAVAHDDQATFDLLLGWTRRNLSRSTDHLHAWRYQPGATPAVADTNNATDGDLMIALALARAAVRWGQMEHLTAAAAIGQDVLRLLVRTIGTRTVLLPAAYGFDKPEGLVINPSYYVFPALDVMDELVPSPVWAKLMRDGTRLLTEARFGRWKLPPDWLFISRVDFGLSPAPGWPPRFSYDAIRVPLHVAWSGVDSGGIGDSVLRFWSSHGSKVPGWVDLNTGETAPYSVNAGQIAVAMLSARCCGGGVKLATEAMPSVRDARDYYAAALVLLARLASSEARIA
jgi:endoglucanase